MNIKENVRINRTKMLDEAAINHRPSHYMHTFFIFLIVYFIASLASSFVCSIPNTIYMVQTEEFWQMVTGVTEGTMSIDEMVLIMDQVVANSPWWVTLCSLITAGASLIGASIIYCKFIEKRPIKTLGLRKTNYVLEYGVGILIGAGMYALTFLIALACGSVEFVGGANFSYPIILFFFAFVIQGAGEEVFVRGYLMTTVARDYKVALALVFSSVAFSLLHAMNSGVSVLALVNIFLFGVFEGIYVLKRGDILGACAIHTMWNFVQGCVLGSSVSGMAQMPSIFRIVSNPEMTAANGGAFGLEGGFSATIVILVAIGLVLLLTPKKSELPDYELERIELN